MKIKYYTSTNRSRILVVIKKVKISVIQYSWINLVNDLLYLSLEQKLLCGYRTNNFLTYI